MSESYDKLKKTLRKIFEIDKADLDFGIYRILNQKRDEINKFMEEDLLSQVTNEFKDFVADDKDELEVKLKDAIDQAKKFGAPDPENTEPVLEIKKKLESTVDITAIEQEVYSYLHTFFSRYYDKGDFISMRRYKKDTYAIPYEGEEVKLHWANSDQYYIKSSEHLRDYAFTVEGDNNKAFRIKLLDADMEKDNVKISDNKERRFIVAKDKPMTVVGNELLIHFNYIPHKKSTKQTGLNKESVDFIFKQEGYDDWLNVLKTVIPTEKNKKRTLLEKHLNDYTARNTFDYFIHKRLGSFLVRELDFYLKNEVLHFDDLDSSSLSITQTLFKKIDCIRNISLKIIQLVSQIEDFQKKLWLKKKFVVSTDYCITLDRVPDKLLEQVVKNKEQLQDWLKLYSIDEVDSYTSPLSISFLRENKFLMLNTCFFDNNFKDDLVSSINDFDEQCDGVLLHSENFQALNFIENKNREQFKCIYIDPPYNTASTPILYKNEYKHSSWASLMQDRLNLSKKLLKRDGVKIVAIDDTEMINLSMILNNVYPDHRLTRVSVVHNPKGSITKDFNRVHEYSLFLTREDDKDAIARTLEENKTPRKMRRWGENSLRTERRLSFYPIYLRDGSISRIGTVPDDDFHPSGRNVTNEDGEIEVWPIDQNGIERRWNFGLDSISENLNRVTIQKVDETFDLFLTHELTVPKTVWKGGEYDAGNYGNSLLINILGEKLFDFPKSINLVKKCVYLATSTTRNSSILDYFGGSGTTAHATIALNREDSGKRKYTLVEMGKHFDDVLMPRIQKIVYSTEWTNGKPKNRNTGISHCFKYLRLESYEDTLNNLILQKNSKIQSSLLDINSELKDEYMLSYWLDLETKDSVSLLNLDMFEDPFNYKLNIATDSVGVTKPAVIDLVETFNYLVGLTVKHIDRVDGFKVVTGTVGDSESVLVIWRVLKEKNNESLESFMDKLKYHPRDTEFDHVYINGGNTLEDPHSKVKIIESEFKRLMFDVQDV